LDWLLGDPVDPQRCLWLADLVVTLHFAVVAFALGGAIAIVLGGTFRWEWVRRPVFRLPHLTVTTIVAVQALLDVTCFLTDWEKDLRKLAGKEEIEEAGFIGRLLHDWLFIEVEQAVLTPIYVVFGLLVLTGLFFVRPRFKSQR